MTEIIEKAKELGAMLQASEQVQRYNAAKAAYEADEEVQKLVKEYNLQRMNMMTLSSDENADASRMEELEERIKEIYNQVLSSPSMVEMQSASEALNGLMGQINGVITFYVTGEEPNSCTHDCSTCGGCH
ncbi:MAG: YlbF family regulator [Clostridia bacterium]|nr:YlbF family regulator [Clostridia bacterium]